MQSNCLGWRECCHDRPVVTHNMVNDIWSTEGHPRNENNGDHEPQKSTDPADKDQFGTEMSSHDIRVVKTADSKVPLKVITVKCKYSGQFLKSARRTRNIQQRGIGLFI